MVQYYAKYGPATEANDYELVPIRPGTKRPFGDKWQNETYHATQKQFAGFGLGVKARHNPGVDLDIRDDDLVEHMKAFTLDLVGPALIRVGFPPKTLLVYRSEEPFRKINSKIWIDSDGQRHKVEILGDGQQFVAFAIHPDTQLPYKWFEKKALHNTPRSELTSITRDQGIAIAAEFDAQAEARGWKVAPSTNALAKRNAGDPDDVFAYDKARIEDLSNDQLATLLMRVPGAEEYDRWNQIGMALYHQFEGDEEGLTLWHQWSSQAANYESDALDSRWSGFEAEGKKIEPITAKIIIKWAKEEEKRLNTVAFGEYKLKLQHAVDYEALEGVCNEIKKLVFSQALRETLGGIVKARLKDFGNPAPTIGLARSMIRYESKEMTVAPPWMKPFCYVASEDRFYSTRTASLLTAKAFDSTYDMHMLTATERFEGKSAPEHHASTVALNRVGIPKVVRRAYMPGYPLFFKLDGRKVVNTYSEETIPEVPVELDRNGRRIIDRMLRHLDHLIPSERDRRMLLSWMAYKVQNPDKRCNWAPLVQGVDGDGKTTIGEWMILAVGSGNGGTINGSALEEKYTGWAEGKCVIIVEEVRLSGENRYAVVNNIKVYISNDVVPIRRMQTDTYDIPNMTVYYLTTNYKDALPAGHNDNRYYPIFSRWQHEKFLNAFKAENPDYYTDLAEIKQFPGVIRHFFLNYELDPEFAPMRRAPRSDSRAEMVYMDRDDDEEALELLLAEKKHLCSEVLLDSALMSEEIVGHGGSAPASKALKRFLSKAGFTALDRHWIAGSARRLWSMTPSMFMTDGKPDAKKIRDYAEDDDPL